MFQKARGCVGAAHYHFGPDLPKPCFHPLQTPSGKILTGFEMSDHIWHRGLWMTVKLVNGTNFWEEVPPFGIQATTEEPIASFPAPNIVRLTQMLEWRDGAEGAPMLEKRILRLQAAEQGGIIDWISELTPTVDVTLDRTPFTTWGGYGGLSFRGSRELHDVSFHTPEGGSHALRTGESGEWLVMSARVDGGAQRRVSVGMIDHPSNPRHPVPWYAKGANGFTFMNAAFLFHEPMVLTAGKTLRIAHRVCYRDGVWEDGQFEALARPYINGEVEL